MTTSRFDPRFRAGRDRRRPPASLLRRLAGPLTIAFLAGCASGTETARGEEPTRTVAFDSPMNLIVVEARIGDREPLRFLLDSGATSTVVDSAVAQRLGLVTGQENTVRGTAAGSRVTIAPIRGGIDLVLAPGLDLHVDRAITAPFTESGRRMIGTHFDGVLGSAIFRRFVVEVDYAAKTLTYHEPEGYRYEGEGSILALEFPPQTPALPFVRATLVNGDNRLIDFPILVDSGGQTMGTASVPARKDWDELLTSENRVLGALGATGLSDDPDGMTHGLLHTRMDRLILGPFEFDGPMVSYSAGGPDLAVMGATLLHRFTATFDYTRKRLILEPNEHYPEPQVTDMSGATLVLPSDRSEGFEVLYISDGTPAEEAGLNPGDRVLSVDGVAAGEIELSEARGMLCRPGTYELTVERGDRRFETQLATRELYR